MLESWLNVYNNFYLKKCFVDLTGRPATHQKSPATHEMFGTHSLRNAILNDETPDHIWGGR